MNTEARKRTQRSADASSARTRHHSRHADEASALLPHSLSRARRRYSYARLQHPVKRTKVRAPFAAVCLILVLAGFHPLVAQAPTPKDSIIVDEKTEGVIKGALKYLAAKQSPNGAWAASPEEQQH